MDIIVTGGDQLADLAGRLRRAARTDLRRELVRGLRAAAKPAAEGAKREVLGLPAHGPKHTGLRGRVAKTVKVQVRTGGRGAGVRITAGTAGTDVGRLARHMNKGRWRHPVYGNRDVWVTQTVPPGWFDRPMRDAAPRARQEMAEVLRRIREQIEG